jgi:hypothetical protein
MGAPFYSSLAERSIAPLNNNFPVRTHSISATFPKHIHTVNQIKVEDHNLSIWLDNLPTKSVTTLNCVSSEDDLFKITLESPLNKAPPLTL